MVENFEPRKGDPDGLVEGVDAKKVVAALRRLSDDPNLALLWDTYDEWKPKFSDDLESV